MGSSPRIAVQPPFLRALLTWLTDGEGAPSTREPKSGPSFGMREAYTGRRDFSHVGQPIQASLQQHCARACCVASFTHPSPQWF
eukprot:5087963-Pyramimonas_sp.AAC.1